MMNCINIQHSYSIWIKEHIQYFCPTFRNNIAVKVLMKTFRSKCEWNLFLYKIQVDVNDCLLLFATFYVLSRAGAGVARGTGGQGHGSKKKNIPSILHQTRKTLFRKFTKYSDVHTNLGFPKYCMKYKLPPLHTLLYCEFSKHFSSLISFSAQYINDDKWPGPAWARVKTRNKQKIQSYLNKQQQ